MKKVKYLLMTLLVGLVTLTGCEKKNSLSPEEAIKKASSNMQVLENYKMTMNMGIGMKTSGIAIDMDVKGDATYDMKNNTAKMNMSTNFAGQDISVQMYMNLKDKNGKVVTYTKSSDDDEWNISTSDSGEVNPNVSDALIKSLSDNKKIEEVKADKNNYNYEMTIDADTFKSLMSTMGNSSEIALDPDSIKGDIILSISIDKKTNNYSKLSIDMKDMMEKMLAENNSATNFEITKAEFVMTFSDYNKAGTVEIPSSITESAGKSNAADIAYSVRKESQLYYQFELLTYEGVTEPIVFTFDGKSAKTDYISHDPNNKFELDETIPTDGKITITEDGEISGIAQINGFWCGIKSRGAIACYSGEDAKQQAENDIQ